MTDAILLSPTSIYSLVQWHDDHQIPESVSRTGANLHNGITLDAISGDGPCDLRAGIIGTHARHTEREVRAMARPETHKPEAKTTSGKTAAPVSDAAMNKAAARAAASSTRLENHELPTGYVRSEGVKILLAEREARKH